MHVGHYISGAAHLSFLLWLVMGDVFTSKPEEISITSVSIISEEQFANQLAKDSNPQVSDEIDILKSLKRTLRLQHYEVVYTDDPRQALGLIQEHKPHVLITDFRMPNMNGQELIQEVKKHDPSIECIVLSGQADYDDMKSLINANNTFKF